MGDSKFRTLMVGSLPPTFAALDTAFAAGVLAALFILKVGNHPGRLSPMLIEWAINGRDAVLDIEWLCRIIPDVGSMVACLPESHAQLQMIQGRNRELAARLVQVATNHLV